MNAPASGDNTIQTPEAPPRLKQISHRLRYGWASVRVQMTIVVLVATLPMMIFVGLFANQQRQAETADAKNQLLFSAKTAAMGYDQTIQFTRQIMQAIAELPSVQNGDTEACNKDLDRVRSNYLVFRGISVNDLEGNVICSSPALPKEEPGNQFNQVWFQKAMLAKQFTVGSYAVGQVSRKGNLTMGKPVFNPDGEMIAIIGLGVSIDALNQSVAGLNLPEGGVMRLYDRDGTIIMRMPNPELYVGVVDTSFGLLRYLQTGSEGVQVATGTDGEERLYGYTTLPSDPHGSLILAVGVPVDEAYENINSNLLRNLIAIGSLALLGIALAWIITERFILRPTQTLASAAHRLTEGDLSTRVKLGTGYGELFELAQDFDKMAESLQEQEAQLRAMNQELELRVAERTTELSNSRDVLQQFSNHLQNVLEEERRKISREIHDELGQALTGLKMDLRYISKHLHPDQEQIAHRISTAQQLVDATITTMRRISSDLRPGILDDLGLVPAVDWLLNNLQSRSGIETMLTVEPENLEIPKEMHTSLYRIIQEALTNVIRHAEASEVRVNILALDSELRIEIKDNGKGFDKAALGQRRSLGLTGIRERASLINGQATIVGNSGGGTRVTVTVPFTAAKGETL